MAADFPARRVAEAEVGSLVTARMRKEERPEGSARSESMTAPPCWPVAPVMRRTFWDMLWCVLLARMYDTLAGGDCGERGTVGAKGDSLLESLEDIDIGPQCMGCFCFIYAKRRLNHEYKECGRIEELRTA